MWRDAIIAKEASSTANTGQDPRPATPSKRAASGPHMGTIQRRTRDREARCAAIDPVLLTDRVDVRHHHEHERFDVTDVSITMRCVGLRRMLRRRRQSSADRSRRAANSSDRRNPRAPHPARAGRRRRDRRAIARSRSSSGATNGVTVGTTRAQSSARRAHPDK